MEGHILTVDVEDNCTFEELKDKNDWLKYEGQVVDNTLRILFILEQFKTNATFFIVGLVAERHPEIVKYVLDRGHEVASHSFFHKPLYKMGWDEIEYDIKKSQELLSALIGKPVYGYRAMGFSIPDNKEFFYSLLRDYGYRYDSSCKIGKCSIEVADGFYKIYPSVLNFFNMRICFSGGSYLRLWPMFMIKRGFRKYFYKKEPVVVYIHPWEFNKDQPKRNIPIKQKILQSPFLYTTEKKIIELLRNYKFYSIKDFLGLK